MNNKIKVLLYCNRGKPYLCRNYFAEDLRHAYFTHDEESINYGHILNGNILAECDIETNNIIYEESRGHVEPDNHEEVFRHYYRSRGGDGTTFDIELHHNSGMYPSDIDDYLKQKDGYAIKITNIRILSEPRSLSNYHLIKSKNIVTEPKHMMILIDNETQDKYILIPLDSITLTKILNREINIIIRKKDTRWNEI